MFYNRQTKELVKLLKDFYSGDGIKRLADEQQKALAKYNEVKREKAIKEKFEYLTFRNEQNLTMTDEDKKELEFVTWFVKHKLKG